MHRYPYNPQIEENRKNSNGIFHRKKKNPKIFVEPQKTLNIQSNLDKEGQS